MNGEGFELSEVSRVPDDLTEDLSPPRLVGMKRFFLEAFLAAGLPGIRTTLLAARDPSGKLLGAFALSRMEVELDCIAGPSLQTAAAAVRRLHPGFLKLQLLMCGLPASMADHEAVLAPDVAPELGERLRRAAVARSLEIVESEGLSACVWKEFDAQARERWAPALESGGLTWFPSLPVSAQTVTWTTPAAYEESLRSSYRRQLRANAARASEKGLSIELDCDFAPHAAEFHAFYLEVLERSSTRLETLSAAFFTALAADRRIRYVRGTLGGHHVGGALCYVAKPDVLLFLYVGMRHAVQREVDLYFNLLKGVVDMAALHGVRELRWGQTSADAKGRMGARLVPLWFAMRLRRPVVHRAVRSLGGLLFPVRGQLERRVFK
ncbi:MAG: hypothetical protein HYY25_12515 [Candidatus Wallbacteria bacterium]|nr:hypothetical protein [Candidatus Wallbacteria bacterium]